MILISGMWGVPLKSVSAFLPTQGTQYFDLYTAGLLAVKSAPVSLGNGPPKDGIKFHAPLRLDAYFGYKEGIRQAKQISKPVFIIRILLFAVLQYPVGRCSVRS